MSTKSIVLKFRKIYKNSYAFLRRKHLKKFCYNWTKTRCKKNVLTKLQKKETLKFWSRYTKINLIYHNYYTEKTNCFSPYYIPDDIYYNYVDMYFSDFQNAKIVDNKCLYGQLFKDIMQPETIALRVNNMWMLSSLGNYVTFDEVIDAINKEDAVFIKRATDCGGGAGVVYFDKSQEKEYVRKIIEKWGGDIIIQKPLIQHAVLSKINPTSVNTIRSLSVISDGKVKIYSSILRMGSNNSHTDNSSAGGLFAGINDDGTVKQYAYYCSGDRLEEHPTTHVKFSDIKIPNFNKVKEIVAKAHKYIPHFRMISWDIAIREDGEPILIEANLSSGALYFHQLTNGPLFGEDSEKILNEVFQVKIK